MSAIKQARTLFRAATRDLAAIRGMFDPEVFANEIFGFHVQQAAEKLCKAWIALLGKEYPFVHDLERLRGHRAESSRPGVLLPYNPTALNPAAFRPAA